MALETNHFCSLFYFCTVMKKISTSFAVFCALALLAAPRAPRAQTISAPLVSGTTFCAGDMILISFTVTGTWEHNNAFTLQISNDSGTFDNGFQDLGSISDTAPGAFSMNTVAPSNLTYRQFSISTVVKPIDSEFIENGRLVDSIVSRDTTYDTVQPTHYRFRIIGASPGMNTYIASADNGTDIVVKPIVGNPIISLFWSSSNPQWYVGNMVPPGAIAGVPNDIIIEAGSNSDSLFCDFGSDASPASAIHVGGFHDSITYVSGGLKTVTVQATRANGCPSSGVATTSFRVYDCTPPQIPHWAIIVDSLNASSPHGVPFYADSGYPHSYWIDPGVHWNALGIGNDNDTFYVEAGATLNMAGGGGHVIYLKDGASLPAFETTNFADPFIVVYATGASIRVDSLPDVMEIPCGSLTFDYTVAPPNVVMGINVNESVAPTAPVAQIEISPNPTNGIVTLQNIPLGSNVMVMNVLGETVQTKTTQSNTNLSLDLSNVTAGTYYIRIASGNSVTTKSIVKE
jgi:hypothetical protein